LKWRWLRGEGVLLENFGDPLSSTDYRLCGYDSSAGDAALVMDLHVPPHATNWRLQEGERFRYKDNSAAADGITRLKLQPGTENRSKLGLVAKGADLKLPAPVSTQRMFWLEPFVTVQLVNSDGECFTTSFASAETNQPTRFTAQTR
jgi:hypothetical protein